MEKDIQIDGPQLFESTTAKPIQLLAQFFVSFSLVFFLSRLVYLAFSELHFTHTPDI
jgi:hypothetical protein